MKKREMNFELLRIVAMCMIIGLHYLDKGKVCGNFLEKGGAAGYMPWMFEAFFFCAVNIYVLISGYFLVQKEPGIKKAAALWGQVLFYSLFLWLLALLTGSTQAGETDIYRLSYYLFPVLTKHYWFITDYLILYLLAIVMNPVLAKMEQKNMGRLLLLFIGMFSLSKSLLPLSLAIDKNGYDVLWFFCLYLTGAYYRRFGFFWCNTKTKGILLYACSSMAIFLSAFVLKEIYIRTGHLKDIVTYAYSYNHIFTYLAAIGLLVWFSGINIKAERAGNMIGVLAGASFGVYLIHEHMDFRYVWQQWLGVEKQGQSPLFPLFMIGSILLVFFVCAGIELIRKRLFAAIAEALRKQ